DQPAGVALACPVDHAHAAALDLAEQLIIAEEAGRRVGPAGGGGGGGGGGDGAGGGPRRPGTPRRARPARPRGGGRGGRRGGWRVPADAARGTGPGDRGSRP